MENLDSIILFDSSCNINDLTSDKIKNSLIITFDYNSHKNLEKSGINHLISDSYLDQHFLSSVDKICYGLSRWYKEKSIEKIVEYDGLNLGEFFYYDVYSLLIPFLKRFFEISKIFEENSRSSFFTSNNLYDIISSFSDNTKILQQVNIVKSEFDSSHMDIQFKLGPKHSQIRISKSKYLKLLNISEKFVNLTAKKQSDKPVILVSNFSSQYQKEFFLAMPQSKNIFVKFDRMVPSFWNRDTYSTVKKSGSIIENFSSLVDDNIKKMITDSQNLINEKLNFLSNSTELHEFFSLNKISFWNAFKKTFLKLLQTKFTEFITEIEIIKKLFSKYKFSCVLVQAEGGIDLVVIKLAKRQNIPIILLQHGLIPNNSTRTFLEHYKFLRTCPVYQSKYLVWGNPVLKFNIENGAQRSKIEVLGAPFYDKIFNKKIPSYTELDNFILFATDFKAIQKVGRITVEMMKKYEMLINSVYNAVMKHNKKLVIRPHPQKDIGEKQIAEELDPKIKVVLGGSILPLIKSSSLVVVTDVSSVMVEAMILNKPVISLRVNPDFDDEFLNPNTCLRTNIEDFENNLSKILENGQFRNLLLKKQKIFLDENVANQGSASIKLIKFLDNLQNN